MNVRQLITTLLQHDMEMEVLTEGPPEEDDYQDIDGIIEDQTGTTKYVVLTRK